MTSQQQLVCNANAISKCLECNQTLMMGALISVFATLAGVSVDCNTLNTLAQQFSCIPRENQLAALLYLASQISQGSATLGTTVFSGVGSPVGVVFPTVPSAQYFDTTIPTQPNVWYYANGQWNVYISP